MKIKKNEFTPMMQQYLSIKKVHQEYLVFYRLGDFYELFFEDAKIASKILNIMLTKKKNKNKIYIPMCGVPHYNVNYHIKKIINKGLKVAICEQLDDVNSSIKKHTSIKKREVVQIITPGTVLEEDIINYKEDNFLISIVKNKEYNAVAYIELLKGNFYVQCYNKIQLLNEIERLNPKEIIIPQGISKDIIFKKFSKNVTIRDDHIYEYINCLEKIKDYYNVNSINCLGNFEKLEIIAAGALIDYIIHTHKKKLPKLKNLTKIKKNFYLDMDKYTISNLEIISKKEQKKQDLLKTIDCTLTIAGKKTMKYRILHPLKNSFLINKRLSCVCFFFENDIVRTEVRKILKYFPNVEKSISKIFICKANFKDLVIIKNGLKIAIKIKYILKKIENLLPYEMKILMFQIFEENLIIEMLDKSITIKKRRRKLSLSFKKGYNRILDKLNEIKKIITVKILKLLSKYRKLTKVKILRLSKNNLLGYFLETTKIQSEKLDKKVFIKKQVLGNTIRFFTSELKELENLLIKCNNKIKTVEKIIFIKVCNKIKYKFDQISLIIDSIANIDFYSALSENAVKYNYTKPIINNSNDFKILEGRHPIIELIQKESFVANSIKINKKILVITGPNMAGKSTFLRQNALIAILAQMGGYVPAKKAKIGVIDKVFTRIGAQDNILKGESTFMREMTETAYILNNATPKSLIILDEVGRGTAVNEGIVIAYSVIDHIFNNIKCRTLFSTHYREIILLSEKKNNIKKYIMQTIKWKNKIIFLYKIVPGVSIHSCAIYVAKLAGMPQNIIQFSTKLLKNFNKENSIKKISLRKK